MKILLAVCAALLLTTVTADSWSWSSNKDATSEASRRSDDDTKGKETQISESQGRHLYSDQDIYSNDTTLDDVIDSILHRSREGRGLDEYGEICTDPNVQEALDKGDDAQARNLIREKLCSLGLMPCDDSQVEGKRPFYRPGGGIYAQGPIRPPYGPPRPMPPPPPGFHKVPPRKVGYEGPLVSKPFISGSGPVYSGAPGPVYNGPFLESPPPSFGSSATFSKPPPGAIIYGSKPPGAIFEGVDAPYDFEHVVGEKIQVDHSHSFGHSEQFHGGFTGKPTIVVNAQGGAASTSGATAATTGGVGASTLQQHVHHHFHHLDENGAKAPPVPVAVPLVTGNAINSEFAAVASSTGGFAPLSPGYAFNKEVGNSASFSSGLNTAGISAASFSGGLNTAGISGLSGVNGLSGLNAGYGGLSQGSLISGNNLNGFSGLGGVNTGVSPIGSLYETVKPVSEAGLGSYGSGFNNAYGSGGVSNSAVYGSPVGSFHSTSPDYFKKELNYNGGGGNQYNSLSGYGQQNKQQYGGQFNQYTGTEDYSAYETARQHVVDCACVPFNQCPAADRIGRKEDLILPIDPRNLGTDIQAEDSTNTTTNGDLPSDSEKDKKVAKRAVSEKKVSEEGEEAAFDAIPRQGFYGGRPQPQQCSPGLVCCRRPHRPQQQQQLGRCGTRNAHGITGRIKNPVYVDGDSEFGEYPWQVAILKKDPKESVYVCGGTVIDHLHVITAAHCIKTFGGFDLRVRLGEWDVNHDVEFFPYIERDIVSVHVHPEYYAGTLDNDLAILKLDHPIDFVKNPHISPACLPDKFSDFTGVRCWTTGWGKDAFGDYGKYQNILKEVDVPVISQHQCQTQLQHTRLGYNYKLNPGFVCAGGEEGKDACKGDGGGPMVCERNGIWNLVGVVSWGIGCGQVNVPGVYVRVSYYLDWINQITRNY